MKVVKAKVLRASRQDDESDSSSSSEESLTGEFPRGHKRKRSNVEEENNRLDEVNNSTEDDESPVVKFRRGEKLDSDLEISQDESQGSVDSDDPPDDDGDDREWNMMGAALEREFLSDC